MTKVIVRGRKSICQILDCSWPKAKKELKRLGLFNHDDGGRPILLVQQYLEILKQSQYSQKNEIGYIYVLKLNEFFKIGKARDFAKRFGQYVTHSPFDLEVVCKKKIEHYHEVEEKLLKKFKKKQVKNEWFKLSENDIDKIKTILELK